MLKIVKLDYFVFCLNPISLSVELGHNFYMKKTSLKISLFFLLGLIVVGGGMYSVQNKTENVDIDVFQRVNKKRVEAVYEPVEEVDEADTILEEEKEEASFIPNETLKIEDTIRIVSDRLVTRKTVPITLISSDEMTVEKLLDVQVPYFGSQIVVEYWDSPLELTGYELSRNRLKLFGFNPLDELSLSNHEMSPQLFLEIAGTSLTLERTERFRTLYP